LRKCSSQAAVVGALIATVNAILHIFEMKRLVVHKLLAGSYRRYSVFHQEVFFSFLQILCSVFSACYARGCRYDAIAVTSMKNLCSSRLHAFGTQCNDYRLLQTSLTYVYFAASRPGSAL
jgi:hypothetical protein